MQAEPGQPSRRRTPVLLRGGGARLGGAQDVDQEFPRERRGLDLPRQEVSGAGGAAGLRGGTGPGQRQATGIGGSPRAGPGRAGRVPLAGRAGGAALGVPQLRAPQPAPEWARPEERRVLIGCKFSFKYKGVFIKSRVGAFSSLQLLTALLLFLFLGVGMLTLLEEPAVTDAEEVSV